MVSIRASLTQFYLRNSKYKKLFSAHGDTNIAMQKLHNIEAALPSSRMRRKFAVSESKFKGQPVYTIAPKNGESSKGHIDTILYFHGGGYVGAISPFHWYFIGRLVSQFDVTVVVPFYLRAPEQDVDANFNMVIPFYDNLVTRYDPSKMMVMGDSAGAGLSLAMSQQLIAAGKTPPAKITLLSPWLDAKGDDPRQADIEPHDCLLALRGLRACGIIYAGNNRLTDPRVSPGLGALDNLPPIAMFAGTHDILLTDALNFKARVDASDDGPALTYYEYDKMHHVWMIIPCPETDKCIHQIGNFIGVSP